jgi:hypothetical protein
MTEALEKAFEEASRLPRQEQDLVAKWLLAELADEKAWDRRFGESQDAIAKLADEALGEVSNGEVQALDPTKL